MLNICGYLRKLCGCCWWNNYGIMCIMKPFVIKYADQFLRFQHMRCCYSIWDIVDRFQHNPKTIPRHFINVLKKLSIFSKERHASWISKCSSIRSIQQQIISLVWAHGYGWINKNPYSEKKSDTTQNVVATCDFSICFAFILADWEVQHSRRQYLMKQL